MHTLLACVLSAAIAAEPVAAPSEATAPPAPVTGGNGYIAGGAIAGSLAFFGTGVAAGVIFERGNLGGDKGEGVLLGSVVASLAGMFTGGVLGWYSREHEGGRVGIGAMAMHAILALVAGGLCWLMFNTLGGPPFGPAR